GNLAPTVTLNWRVHTGITQDNPCPRCLGDGASNDGVLGGTCNGGSRNGLTIAKPLTIKGAGAGKTIIEPAPALGDSLAGTQPYLRDGGGNVITISRQSLGDGDYDENTVDISGVTVRSPYAYAEAGVAYFNTSGTISDSTIGPLKRPSADETTNRPYGWGVIQTNFLQGAGGGSGTVRRQVSVVDSLVTGYQAGGILFDGARGADGTPESAARAGITQYGYVTGTKVVGGGSASGIFQTGVRYFAGTRGAITNSQIQDNAYLTTSGNAVAGLSYGVMLADAETGADPDNPSVRALTITGNTFVNNTIGLYNGDITSAAGAASGRAIRTGAPVYANDNSWGCITGPLTADRSNTSTGCQTISGNDAASSPAPSVEVGTYKTTVPTELSAPGAITDAAPTAAFTEPVNTPEISVGDTISPVVSAGDDFGVTSVELLANGTSVATLTHAPYEFGWSPSPSDAGTVVTLVAKVTDSAGQVTTASTDVKVAALPAVTPTPTPTPAPEATPTPTPVPPAPKPPVNTALPVITGDATVGEAVTCLPGSWTADPTAYSYTWLVAGKAVAGANAASYTIAQGDTASTIACTVVASNADGAAAATSTTKLVTFPIDSTGDDVERQVGPVVVSVLKKATLTKAGKVTVGTVDCVRDLATTCTTTVSGSVKVGSRTFSVKSVKVTGAAEKSLSLTLTSAARAALAHGRSGVLSLSIASSDDTGFKSSWKTSLTVKGPR
ncbi:MAG: Ig-like domain-containing protein, partial [Patulibacter sp.]|nr:Ig-like domain-containing protein [Patulibacter sp.]